MKKGHFRLTCVAQKRCCLSSLISHALPYLHHFVCYSDFLCVRSFKIYPIHCLSETAKGYDIVKHDCTKFQRSSIRFQVNTLSYYFWFAPCDISGVDTSSWVLPFQVQIHVADCHNSGLNTRCWVQQLKCAHIAEYYNLWGRHKLNANIHFFETLCWLLQFQVQTNHVDNSGLVTPQ